MDKSTISVARFNSKLLVCQRVSTKFCIPPVVTGPPKASLRAVRTLLRRDADEETVPGLRGNEGKADRWLMME